jgi:hypothetical protein
MVSLRNLAFVASTIVGLSSAVPTEKVARQFTSGTLNNTQEFYIRMCVTAGDTTYDGYAGTSNSPFFIPTQPSNNYIVEAYHTGAGFADPVFVEGAGSPAYLNGTNLQFDVSPYPFSANGIPADTNYARWEPIDITSGYGNGPWIIDGANGLTVDQEEHGGWLVCEWYHGVDAPQLFQLITGFDTSPDVFPSTCAKVLLIPEYI